MAKSESCGTHYSVRNWDGNQNGNELFWAASHSPFPLKQIGTKFCQWQLLSILGPSVPIKAFLAFVTWDSGHSGSTALGVCISTWGTSTLSFIGHFTYIICKLEDSPTPKRWRNNVKVINHPAPGYEAQWEGDFDWPSHLCCFSSKLLPKLANYPSVFTYWLKCLSPLDWNTLKAEVVTYPSKNSQNQPWCLVHNKHPVNISWVCG